MSVAALSVLLLLGTGTVASWERYVAATEDRIERELSSPEGFLAIDFLPGELREEAARALDAGEVFVARVPHSAKIEGGMAHHWLGAVIVPEVEVEDLVRWLQEYDRHQFRFAEVEESRLLSREGDRFEIFLRLRRKKIVTVRFDTEHEVIYRRHGGGRISSASRSTRIQEIDRPEGEDRGFLRRLNSYWRFEQREGGVVVECESISLSRSIPAALRWLVRPYLDAVPRESLVSTLEPIREGSRRTLVQRSSLRSKIR